MRIKNAGGLSRPTVRFRKTHPKRVKRERVIARWTLEFRRLHETIYNRIRRSIDGGRKYQKMHFMVRSPRPNW